MFLLITLLKKKNMRLRSSETQMQRSREKMGMIATNTSSASALTLTCAAWETAHDVVLTVVVVVAARQSYSRLEGACRSISQTCFISDRVRCPPLCWLPPLSTQRR